MSISPRDLVTLKRAVVEGDTEILISMSVERSGLVNISLNNHRETLLHWCRDARGGNIAAAQFLVQNGAKLNIRDKYGQSPLCCAVAKNNLSLVRFLLSSSAHPNLKMLRGNTPLHHARTEDVTEELLRHHALVNEANDYGQTPLFSALLENKGWPVVKLLLDHGANVHMTDMAGNTLLHCCDDSYMAREFLSRGVDVNKTNSNGYTPLHTAIIYEKEVALIRELLKHGADPNRSESAKLVARERAETTDFDDRRPMEVLLSLLEYGAEFQPREYNRLDDRQKDVERQILKMIVLRDVDNSAFIHGQLDMELYNYKIGCKSKKLIMKDHILADDLTVFEILTARVDSRKEIVRNHERLADTLLSEYEEYEDVLAPKLQRSLERTRLLVKMRTILLYTVSVTGNGFIKRTNLNEHCTDALAMHLSDGDLINLIAALE